MHTVVLIAGIITGCYEVVVRFIPTVSDITILGNIIKFLGLVSNFFNAKK